MGILLKQSISLFLSCFAFLAFATIVDAATLEFSPSSQTVSDGETFTVDIIIDADGSRITGTDVYVQYDPSVVQPTSDPVELGTYFPVGTEQSPSDQIANSIYINGFVTDPADFREGSGTLASVTFRKVGAAGGVLEFFCDQDRAITSKIVEFDPDAPNILECSDLSTFTINSGTTAPTNSPIPTSATNITNTPTELPKSGVFDDLIVYAISSVVFIGIGTFIKLLA